jgi:transglutaminase-like putative cysteine protease
MTATALFATTKTRKHTIPSGDAGTRAMLDSMKRNVARDYLKPIVRLTAVEIVRGLPARQDGQQIAAIRDWMVQHFQFLRDPRGAELNYSPEWMIREVQKTGVMNADCDDAAVLAASLGKAIGLRARFVCLAFFSKSAGFSHVYTDLASPIGKSPKWVEMDVTRGAQSIPVSQISRRMEAEV